MSDDRTPSRGDLVPVSSVPMDVATAEIQAGMGNRPFSPGTPMAPFDGYSATPRTWDYQSGYNIAARPRRNERVAFDTLRGLIDAYDVAQMCIWHRIDSVRSLSWALVAAPGAEGEDLTRWQDIGMAALKKPDRKNRFKTWLSMYLYDVLAYDAGTLYRIRNGAGRAIGLKVVDGTTIAPLLDYYGDTPMRRLPADPAPPAYVQFVQGIPWTSLTDDDLIYEPFRPTSGSPYGKAPIESILLNANTDLRFQQHFLQKFTDGNIPKAFATSPEGWSPDQVREFQDAWDAFMLGDQAVQQQIKWVPNGTAFAWNNEQTYDDKFSLFLMRKTAAAYHVTPQDLGFTEDVNRATSDTQVDNQFRVGDLPLIEHIQGILDGFLQDDMGLPLALKFDTGQEQEDRLQTAQSDAIYIDRGVIGVSEIREKRYGLDEPEGQTIPRFINNSRSGPIPLNSLLGVAGAIDPATGAPVPGTPLPQRAAQEVPGVMPSPPIAEAPLAVDERGPDAYPAPPPPQPAAAPVAKAATERAAFDRFVKARRRAGKWRDFQFTTLDPATAHRLNASARAEIRKAAGELVAAGLCVRAADTGRVLMLQRGLDAEDPASGTWEFPGGCLEDGEAPLDAAVREWQEETGCLLPASAIVGADLRAWTSRNGVYAGTVVSVESETQIDLGARGQVRNPDDPDGDVVEAIAWWDPALLPGNPAIRSELAADLDCVLVAIGHYIELEGDFLTVDEARAAAAEVVEVGKAAWRDNPPNTPHAQYDLAIVDHYAPLIADAMQDLWTDAELTAAVTAMASTTEVAKSTPAPLPEPKSNRLADIIRRVVLDAFLGGDHAAAEQIGHGALVQVSDIDWGAWTPGSVEAAQLTIDGGLRDMLDQVNIRIQGINDTTVDRLGNLIAQGLAQGDPVQTVAGSLRGLLGDVFRSEVIAHTEMARAMTTASLDSYRANGISQWDLETTGGACKICLDVEARNPHPVSDVADAAPLHPLCRCAVSPVVPTG